MNDIKFRLNRLNPSCVNAQEPTANDEKLNVGIFCGIAARHLKLRNWKAGRVKWPRGRVVDFEMLSKYCRCLNKYNNEHIDKCVAKLLRNQWGIEVKVCDCGLSRRRRGDCKAFINLSEIIESYLRVFKLKSRGKNISDRKPFSGRRRLTDTAANNITKYYGLAIRRNCQSNSTVDNIKHAIWSEYFLILSRPQHGICPEAKG
ncbi:hypothetical protein J6590_041309, partial [Homalodisca vitripennis]